MKYPDNFINKVICGDCLEMMKDIPDNSVDLVLTDPPYGYGKFTKDNLNNLIIIEKVFKQIKRILKNNHWAFVFWGTKDLDKIFNAIKMDFQRLLFIYKPADITYPYRGWLLKSEVILLFSNGTNPVPLLERKPYKDDCYIIKKLGRIDGVKGHPTVKYLEVVLDLCRRYNGIILDPFLGSGTTAVACIETGRRFIGIEVNPEYCKIANKRIKKALARKEKSFNF